MVICSSPVADVVQPGPADSGPSLAAGGTGGPPAHHAGIGHCGRPTETGGLEVRMNDNISLLFHVIISFSTVTLVCTVKFDGDLRTFLGIKILGQHSVCFQQNATPRHPLQFHDAPTSSSQPNGHVSPADQHWHRARGVAPAAR